MMSLDAQNNLGQVNAFLAKRKSASKHTYLPVATPTFGLIN